jgi:sulfofructose kinase
VTGPTVGGGAFDVVGLGASAVDELLWVASFPTADSKVRVLRRARACGGLGATSLVAAARLGSRAAYAGVLGSDESSRFVIDSLEAKGVNTQHVHLYPGAMPVLSVIILDDAGRTRTILYDCVGMVGPEADWLPTELLTSATVLLVDNYRIDLTIRAARLARSAGASIVADLEDASSALFDELVGLVDHLILSSAFATAITGAANPAEAAKRLHAPGRTVVITCGPDGAWYLPGDGQREARHQPGEARHQPAFRVNVVDTNGCGDVFHGAYASALAGGVDLPARVRFASAVAALAATTPGGQEGIPDAATVTRFLAEQS